MIFNVTKNAEKLSLESLKTHACKVPWYQFQVFTSGDVEVCCQTWLNKPIGNFFEHTAKEVLYSPVLEHIKQDILDGHYSYCNDSCPYLVKFLYSQPENGGIKHPFDYTALLDREALKEHIRSTEYEVYFNFDRSCNLQCPSCRSKLEFITKSKTPEAYDRMSILMDKTEDLVELLLVKENTKTVIVNITGSGDPFASELYWNYLLKLNEVIHLPKYEKLRIRFQTNGILFTPERINKIKNLWNKFDTVAVSVDAQTQETYSIVRKGGTLKTVHDNLKWLDQQVLEGNMSVDWNGVKNRSLWCVNFIVQTDNYKEMADFARYHLQANTISRIWFNLIADWNIFPGQFDRKAIWKETHPEHANFLEVLKDPIFLHEKMDLGSLSYFVNKAHNKI